MPTRSRGDAEAVDARPDSAATAAAAIVATAIVLRTEKLPSHRCNHPVEALVEPDLGFPAEHLARARDVGLANLGVVDRQCLEHDRTLRRSDFQNLLRQLEQRPLLRVPEVDGKVFSALGEQVEAANQVVDVAEAASLRTVPEDGQRL